MKKIAVLFLAFCLSGTSPGLAENAHPTVVELYTSQGCSSCPPADAFLGDLKARDDVIALTLPVDYWDYLGWRDTYARAEHTSRQRDYARASGTRQVYTPQMIVDGAIRAVGSRRDKVNSAIRERARMRGPRVPVTLIPMADGSMRVVVGAGQDRQAQVWLVRFDDHHAVQIGRGENRGRTISYHNVVRDMKSIGTYDGQEKTIDLPMASLWMGDSENCAVLIQERKGIGAIVGAAQIRLAKR